MSLSDLPRADHDSHYLHGIDVLRAIAVLAVIVFHLKASALPGGFTGVDVFFLISGYVVSKSLIGMTQLSFGEMLQKFYVRRLFRLYPALLVMLLCTVLLQMLFVPASWLSSASLNTGLAAFFGLSNVALIWSNDGYFSPRVEFNPFAHTWSLAVEEQFYLLFPALLFPWIRSSDRHKLISQFARLFLPILLVLSLLFSWKQSLSAPAHAYYLLPSRFWELASGAALFLFHRHQRLLPNTSRQVDFCIWSGLTLVAIGLVFADANAFPFPWAVLPVCGAALAICGVAGLHDRATGNILFSNKVMRYIGKLSYSLYLWHWPVIVLLRWTVGVANQYIIVCAAIAILFVSMSSYHFLEIPLRKRIGATVKSESRYLLCGGIAIVACAALAFGIAKAQPYFSLSLTRDSGNWYPYPEQVVGKVRGVNSVLSQRRLYVLGDSHTGAYRKMLSMLSLKQGMAITEFSQAGCAIAGLIEPIKPECEDFTRRSVMHILSQSVPGDVVFLASLRMHRMGDQWAVFDSDEMARKIYSKSARYAQEQAVQEASQLIKSLQGAGLVVIIDAPKPIFPSPPFRCADWFNKNNPICSGGLSVPSRVLLNRRQSVMQSLVTLQQAHPGLVVWDPFPILCPGNVCYAYDGNKPLFFDGDHLSGHGNRVLYPAFLGLLQALP